MAMLSALPVNTVAQDIVAEQTVVGQAETVVLSDALPRWPISRIEFSTGEETRRSMALNGMRMSMEYFDTGSPRIFQLIENRLAAGQRDVVHDVLVYLMQQVLDVRARAAEARDLRAESIAAYLGLQPPCVRLLLHAARLSAASIAATVEADFAGPVRRTIDIRALIESQLGLLRPQLRQFSRQEQTILQLMDAVAMRLHRDNQGPRD